MFQKFFSLFANLLDRSTTCFVNQSKFQQKTFVLTKLYYDPMVLKALFSHNTVLQM